MELFRAIKTRRSIREFSGKKVPKRLLAKIAEAGTYAPSSKNSQPWHFVVDTTKKKDMAAAMLEKKATERFTVMDPRTGNPARPATAKDSARIIRDAAAVIFVFSKSPFTGGRDEVLKSLKMEYLLSYSSEVESIAAAAQNMLLAAHALGLGAVWNCDTYFICDYIKKLYGQEYDFQLALCIGYPKSLPKHRIERKKNYEFA